MILAVLQARMSSSRLPGKVLLPLAGAPMLQRQIERVQRARRIDELVVATSEDSSDDAIAQLAERLGIRSFRGSLEDVLERLYRAALPYSPRFVVRLTGDCPLTEPDLVDAVVERLVAGGFDYVNTSMVPTYPDGLNVEAMRFEVLAEAHRNARLASQREHVTLYIKDHPERYRLGVVSDSCNRSNLRWTVDAPEDYELVRRIYEKLYPKNPAFGRDDVFRLLASDPALSQINAHLRRNEGLARSLAHDRIVPRHEADE